MAVAARPQMAARMDSTKIALIVFVVLTVLSLGGTIFLYTKQTELQTAADDKQKQADTAMQSVQKSKQEVTAIASKLTGKGVDDPAEIAKAVETALQPIAKDERLKLAGVNADATLTSVLTSLYKAYASGADTLAKTAADLKAANDQIAAVTKQSEERANEFNAKSRDLELKYTQLEQQGAANQQAWNQQVEDLKKRLEGASAGATQTLASERQMRQKLEKDLQQHQARMTQMSEKLAKFTPGSAQISLEQMADGQIVRATAGDSLVYVDLGRRDHVMVGMPFSVYSRTRGFNNGKEKATIEVANVFDTTAECRVTSTTKGDPILEGDVIVNLVFDKGRQFNFVVAGDFDLNYDGKMDDRGGEKVAAMIMKWGGRVVSTVDTNTDFVVLGAPPVADAKPADNDDAAKQRAAQQDQNVRSFAAVRAEAKSLSIPVLNRNEFFNLVGMPRPAGGQAEMNAAR
jgi:hypothetical protein